MTKKILSFSVLLGLSSACLALAQSGGNNVTTGIPAPYSNTDFNVFLANILRKMQEIIAYLAVMFIVIGGVMYMLSSGNENMAKLARACWTAAIVGLIIAAAAPSFLREISGILFGGAGIPSNPDQIPTMRAIVMRGLSFLLSIVGTLGIIGLVISGLFFLSSGVNKNQAETAKKAMRYSIIGIAVAALSLALVRQIVEIMTA